MTKIPEPYAELKPYLLEHELLSKSITYLLDTNILNFAVTSPGGDVIHRLNACLEKGGFTRAGQDTSISMTPLQIIEVLGIAIPEIPTLPSWKKGETAQQVIQRLTVEARSRFQKLREISQAALQARAEERAKYLPEEGKLLFGIIMKPLADPKITDHLIVSLTWDYVAKATYPREIERDAVRFLALQMITPTEFHLSRFRIAKRMWDIFYRARRGHNPEARSAIEAANKAMRLKTKRDFLDGDIFHQVCFGREEDDVVAFTCDPPDAVLARIAVYKGMYSAAGSWGRGLEIQNRPKIRAGIIARCDPSGEITHIFPVQQVPTIV